MNIVKGVADLIWRNSSGDQSREYGSTSQSRRFALPTQNITFSEEGDEAILKALWEKIANAVNEVEKKKSKHIFLNQFLITFRNWKPYNLDLSLEEDVLVPSAEYMQGVREEVVGCMYGHPADVICLFIEEIREITRSLSLTDSELVKCLSSSVETVLM